MCLALIACDEEEPDLTSFVEERRDDLECFELVAMGTIDQRPVDATGFDIGRKQFRPFGGDMQIGAGIASKTCNSVISLHDPLTVQPHGPDITALFRICDVHQTSLATNLASANAVLDGLIRQLGSEE